VRNKKKEKEKASLSREPAAGPCFFPTTELFSRAHAVNLTVVGKMKRRPVRATKTGKTIE